MGENRKKLFYVKCIFFYFQRSYRKELFDVAVARMRRACIRTELEIKKFMAIQNRVEQLVIPKAREEVDFGDFGEVPHEFRGT